MSNMSYCRFENTVSDLRDCSEHMEDEISESETKARARLLKLCIKIACEHGGCIVVEDEED